MARLPKLREPSPTVTADWQWHNEWPITTDAIMTGAWQMQKEHKTVLLFANVSDNPFASHLELDPIDYDLSGKSTTVTVIRADGTNTALATQATDQPEIELAARSVCAWEIMPAPGN
jgi:hypothetical protein